MALSKTCALILITASNFVFAQSADLEVEADFETSNDVYFGFVGDFNLTLTNNGPDTVNESFIISPLLNDNGYILGPNTSIPQPDCFIYFVAVEPRPPDFEGGSLLVMEPSPVQSGESITYFGIYGVLFAHGRREMTWITRSIGNAIPDPIPENNSVTISLVIPPQPVNTLAHMSLLILIFIVLLFGIKQRI